MFSPHDMMGIRDVLEAVKTAGGANGHRAIGEAQASLPPRAATDHAPARPQMLRDVPPESWRSLAARAAEPNGYNLPDWALAVDAFSRGRTGNRALTAWNDNGTLIGLMPTVSAWRAYGLPLPALVTADVYPPLGTVLLDRDKADEAAGRLMRQARAAGARALILRDTPLDGPVTAAFTRAMAWDGLRPRVLHSHARALLDATRDAEELLREALGAKKLKELRRQRNRLADTGDVTFTIAATPENIAPALEVFLQLEASGWKARRGTALIQDEAHLAFIRRAVHDMAARGECEVISLYAGETPVAAAIVLRHLDRAFYFKLGVDERFAKCSPGVLLTLELTRHMCADERIASVDSTAMPGHPMIDPIWRDRLPIGDVLIPLRRRDPLVGAIRLALNLRRQIREPARRIVHTIRKVREKHS